MCRHVRRPKLRVQLEVHSLGSDQARRGVGICLPQVCVGLGWAGSVFSVALGFSLTALIDSSQAVEPTAAAVEVDRRLDQESAAPDQRSPSTSDEVFLRRVFLDLVGQPPTVDDVLAFCFDTKADKRAKIVEVLLGDEQFGRNWARYWRDVILYRRTDERSLIVGGPVETYLTEQLNRNVPWDQLASTFITASGNVRERGDTALIMAQFGKPEDVVSEISRIFMGIQIQCAQCHDHPADSWKREQFHQLAAFFPRVAVRPQRNGGERTFLVTVTDRPPRRRRPNNNNRYFGTLEHFMPDLEHPAQQGTKMQPVFFVTQQQLAFGSTDDQRRSQLAKWVTAQENPWFAKALVNRVWAELVGEGFYEPVDDLGPERQCSAPQTVDYLSREFVASGFDLKWLYRTVIATQAYQRESRSRRDFDEDPFQANCGQRLRGDQLFDSLVATLDLPERPANSRQGQGRRRRTPRIAFNAAFGYDPSQPREEVKSSIPQALLLMNSPFINQAIDGRRAEGLGGILRKNDDDATALVELYVRTLSRAPSATEVRTCLSYIRKTGDRSEAFEDIQWALINSTEFLHRR